MVVVPQFGQTVIVAATVLALNWARRLSRRVFDILRFGFGIVQGAMSSAVSLIEIFD